MTRPGWDPPRPAVSRDAADVAALHAAELGAGFLATLGPRFLRRLYARATRSGASFVLVTEDADGLTGFVAVAERTGRFYREFLIHDGLLAGLAAAPAVLRAPRRTWETFRYGTSASGRPARSADGTDRAPETGPGNQTGPADAVDTDAPPAAEILAIAVAPRARGRGTGTALVAAAVGELRRRGIDGAKVVTAVDNAPAIGMYERAGFRRHHRTEVHAGVAQEVLVWR
jgi:ribosomal protein S18 acetylase RimI-like enzyme